jgi:hypothetical protein
MVGAVLRGVGIHVHAADGIFHPKRRVARRIGRACLVIMTYLASFGVVRFGNHDGSTIKGGMLHIGTALSQAEKHLSDNAVESRDVWPKYTRPRTDLGGVAGRQQCQRAAAIAGGIAQMPREVILEAVSDNAWLRQDTREGGQVPPE